MQAILITAYKNFFHLEDIIDFFNEDFTLYIHIDKKSSISNEQLESLRARDNVSYISQQYNINWGGINHLKAILDLSKKALENEDNEYFHLITGHDYPIKSVEEITSFGKMNSDKIFMEYNSLPYAAWPEGGIDRLSRYNMYDILDGRRGIREKIIKGFSKLQLLLGINRSFKKDFPPLYGGSTYWSFSKEALNYVFVYLKEHPKYLQRFKYSFCSEEIFFQTILVNSPLKEKIINDNMRFIIWEKRNNNFPANLDNSDFDKIAISNALFARKFEFPVSDNLLLKIKERNSKVL